MIDIPLHMFASLVVTGAANCQEYEKGFSPLLKKSGGGSGTCKDQPLHLEMHSPRPGSIIPSCFLWEEVGRNWLAIKFLTSSHRLLPRH